MTDSIGIEMGDSAYVFGAISDAKIPEVTQGANKWKFSFSDDLIIAWTENPEDFQKIYMLEIQ